MFSINVWKTDRVSYSDCSFWKPFYAPKQMKLGTYLSGRGSSVFQYLLYENTWDTSIKQQLCWSLQVIMTRMTSLTFFVGKKCQIVMPGWNFKKFAKNLCGHNRSLTILKTIVFSRAAAAKKKQPWLLFLGRDAENFDGSWGGGAEVALLIDVIFITFTCLLVNPFNSPFDLLDAQRAFEHLLVNNLTQSRSSSPKATGDRTENFF